MRRLLLALVLLAPACADPPEAEEKFARAVDDSGLPIGDGGVVGIEDGDIQVVPDAALPPDAAPPPVDAAIPPDAAPPPADAMPGTPDAAPGMPDAAPGTPDAAPGTPDAAPGAVDAAPGSEPDAATVEEISLYGCQVGAPGRRR